MLHYGLTSGYLTCDSLRIKDKSCSLQVNPGINLEATTTSTNQKESCYRLAACIAGILAFGSYKNSDNTRRVTVAQNNEHLVSMPAITELEIREVKEYLRGRGVSVRL